MREEFVFKKTDSKFLFLNVYYCVCLGEGIWLSTIHRVKVLDERDSLSTGHSDTDP